MSRRESAPRDLTFVGLDVHKGSITSAVCRAKRETPVVDRFFHEASIRCLSRRSSTAPHCAPAMGPGRPATSSLDCCTASASPAR